MTENQINQIISIALSEGICFDCNLIKFIYHTIIDPNIDTGPFTELNRKSKDELVCSKHKLKPEKGTI